MPQNFIILYKNIESSYWMRRQIKPCANEKVSLSQLSNSVMVPYNQRSIPNFPNHIFWSSDNQNQSEKLYQNYQSKERSQKRRKIFASIPAKKQLKLETCNLKVSIQNNSKENDINRIKDQKLFSRGKDESIQQQIQQINRQLHLHRSTVQNQKYSNNDTNASKVEAQANWIRIQDKLTESQQILKKQNQLLTVKLPIFQQKIEETNSTVNEISKVLKLKLESQDRRMLKLTQSANKSSSQLKTKEDQLYKANSSLQKRQNELSKNLYQSKKQALELERIRRIEVLQEKNLLLYNKLEKGKSTSKKYQFEDYVINKTDQKDTGEIWSDDENKFQNQKISKIYYAIPTKDNYNSNYSPNNTITELLSPLALNDSKLLL